MKQKYDSDYTWLYQHTRKHLGRDDETPGVEDTTQVDNDGINVDSDVIVSEYRLLYLKYKDQIAQYKEAIANISLKQIINNEEQAWVEHRSNIDSLLKDKDQKIKTFISNNTAEQGDKKIFTNIQTFEFDQEITNLSV